MNTPFLPYKSTALAIVLGTVLGPIGLLYGSLYFACPFIILGFFAVANGLPLLIAVLWVIATILNVFSVERYNRKLFQHYMNRA